MKLRTLTELPRVRKLKMEALPPCRPKPRTEKVELRATKSKMDNEEPSLEEDRRLRELPISVVWNTLN
jgi:hypothetical protein